MLQIIGRREAEGEPGWIDGALTRALLPYSQTPWQGSSLHFIGITAYCRRDPDVKHMTRTVRYDQSLRPVTFFTATSHAYMASA